MKTLGQILFEAMPDKSADWRYANQPAWEAGAAAVAEHLGYPGENDPLAGVELVKCGTFTEEAQRPRDTITIDHAIYKRLQEALRRVYVHGVHSLSYSATEAESMKRWIEGGMIGELPGITNPFVREDMERLQNSRPDNKVREIRGDEKERS